MRIPIATINGIVHIEDDGFEFGGWIAHHDNDNIGTWIVTHAASGRCIREVCSGEESYAIQLAKRLAGIEIPPLHTFMDPHADNGRGVITAYPEVGYVIQAIAGELLVEMYE